ncbi:hypothetical protein ACQ4LE_008839 [Meloidogyne hapla]
MDEENKFVDVCGDLNEDNKENCFNIKQSKIKIKEENIKIFKREKGNEELKIDGNTSHSSTTIKNKQLKINENESETSTTTSVLRRGPSRKEKSLGKLCAPFLERVALEAAQGRDVHLESVARSMNVEKRRIYDIVNVMEALEVMQKTNKSFYKWHGLDRLPELMFALQRDAQKGELPIKIAKVEKAMCSFTTNFNINFNEEKNKLKEEKTQISEELPEDDEDSAFGPLTSRDRCGKNSLAQLCRRFLMVLLCNPNRAVSLDVVSTMLIKDLDSEGYEPPSRSRCRRLYDIANVLAMMSLVEKKHHLFGTKKIPLFVYCGPEPDAEPTNSAMRMNEFLSRAHTRVAVSGVSLIPSTHPPIPSPDVGCSNSPKYLQNEFKEENNESEDKKKKLKKMRIEENNTLIPTLSPSEENEFKNSVKRRKLNRVVSQQQQEHKEDENFNLPRPQPLHPQQFNICSTENIIPQQQQMFLLPTFPSSSSQTFYCWPAQQQNQNQVFAALTTPTNLSFAERLFLNNSPLIQKQNHKSPPKNPTKVRHSVQSILGFTTNSQKENIQNNSCQQQTNSSFSITSSPRAFRPLIPQQQVKKDKEEKIKKCLPFTHHQRN